LDKKYFGTDGIRGRVGEGNITPEFVLKLGWAAGRVFGGNPGSKVLIGKDTRISGYMFESALEAGLAAAGVNIHLLGPMPTPGVAYLTRTLHAQAGIVISASHNPHYDNPKFVEDMVRAVAVRLNNDDRISAYSVESENFESIHNHSAYALIELDKESA